MAKPNKQVQQNKRPTTVSAVDRADDARGAIAMADHTPMTFREDKFYNGELLYPKGEVCQVPNNTVDRWIKRGGAIVGPGEEIPVPEPVEPVGNVDKDLEKGSFVDPDSKEQWNGDEDDADEKSEL